MARTLALLTTMALTGLATMHAGSLGINPGNYLNPDGTVSIGLLKTAGSINDGITTSGVGYASSTLINSALVIDMAAGGSAAEPQTSTSCASACQGGLTSVPPYTPGSATIFQPASAPEFDLIGDSVDHNSSQAWISVSTGAGAGAGTVTIPVGIFGVQYVDTMLNVISGLTTGGTICTSNNGSFTSVTAATACTNTASYSYVTLNLNTKADGSGTSATDVFALINGVTQGNILNGVVPSDYSVTNGATAYEVYTDEVFSSTISGGPQSGDTLVLDSQEFPIFSQYQGYDLLSVSVTDTGAGGTNHEVLSAITVETAPEPSTILMLVAGFGAMGVSRFRRKVS